MSSRFILVAALCCLIPVVSAESTMVSVAQLKSLWSARMYDAPASVLSINKPVISSEIQATVETIAVQAGDVVLKDDVLIRLDCETLLIQQAIVEAQQDKVQSQLQFANAQLSRANNLKTKKSISEELLDQRRTELKNVRADNLLLQQQLRQAEIDVSHCDIRSPFDAVVTKRMVSEGDFVVPGTGLVQLMQIENLEVKADLTGLEFKALKQAEAIYFVSNEKQYTLKMRAVIPQFSETSATTQVRFRVMSKDMPWPGETGRLQWQSSEKLLPADLVTRRGEQLGVFYLRSGKAIFHKLDHAVEGMPVSIDLPAEVDIVIEGRQGVEPGMPVTISVKPLQ